MFKKVPYRVLLPPWIWEEAQNENHFKQLVIQYMQRYPHYKVLRIEGKFAVCERKN